MAKKSQKLVIMIWKKVILKNLIYFTAPTGLQLLTSATSLSVVVELYLMWSLIRLMLRYTDPSLLWLSKLWPPIKILDFKTSLPQDRQWEAVSTNCYITKERVQEYQV